jgi:exo-1,4-beta-D-glucosaminidase
MKARFTFFFSLVLLFSFSSAAAPANDDPPRFFFHGLWSMQSSCTDKSSGEAISTTGYPAKDWHKAEIPGTVVGALVANHTFSDPNFGMNLKSFPGMDYSSKSFFANQDMPTDSPFRCSYWFRMEFESPREFADRASWLHFLGINYRANIWLNGSKITDRSEVAGPYRTYDFNITKLMRKGMNALAVEVFAPQKNDLGLTWVDWNPTPPDKDMGIWREVFLDSTGEVALRHPFVASKLDTDYANATLNVSTELANITDHSVNATLQVELGSVKVSQPVTLGPNETKIVAFDADKFPQLKLTHPHLWWPYQMGEPYLYNAKFTVIVADKPSASASFKFGIREVTSELTEQGYRLFKINSKRVLIRGAAWAPDMLLRWSSSKLDADLAYTKHMGLNTVRLEGKVDREEFFEKTDALGILVMPGWICCDAWERWKVWTPETQQIAADSLRDQISRLRNHASVFVWLYGSDGPPPADIEKMYVGILNELHWPNPSVSSASERATSVTGKSGVKMTGPYEYVPPMYWLSDKKAGGAYSYNTETSPGPAIPTKESLAKFIPKDHLWPIDEYWNFHAGGERFTNINVFTDALNKRYGPATSLDDFERKAQAMTYDNQRAMFEAYGRNKYTSTGVIQWMLNNAWPSLIWHLYDYYLVPAGGYFGTKKSTEIVHVQYSYDDNSVAVVNGTYEPLKGLKVSAKLYNIDAKEAASQDSTIDVPADGSAKAFDLPKAANLSTTYFLKLQLHDASGKLISDNFYWLSTKLDTMNWRARKDTVYTPQKDFADLTGLNSLPLIKLEASASVRNEAEQGTVTLKIKNSTNSIAFLIHPRLAKAKDGDDIVPVFWDDNYFSLLPGEEKTVSATYNSADLKDIPTLTIDAFNIALTTVQLAQ